MNERIEALADRSPNFGFLYQHEPLLLAYGAGAEAVVFGDPNSAMVKARQFGEVLAMDLVRRGTVRVEGNRHVDRLRALGREGFLHGDVSSAFDHLRSIGNRAVHQHLGADNDPAAQRIALEAVQVCFRLGVWFHRLLTGSRDQMPFIPPDPPTASADTAELAKLHSDLQQARQALVEARLTFENKTNRTEAESEARRRAEAELAQAHAVQQELAALVTEMRHELRSMQTQFDTGRRITTLEERERLSTNAELAAREPLGEAQVRQRLDRMLNDAGWSVQDAGVGQDLWAAQGVAIREVTTKVGRADYFLHVDRKLVGVIEAKREGADLTAAEQQADDYADGLTASQRRVAWRVGLPFRYATDGGATRFRNTLDPDSRSRLVSFFHKPATFARWMHDADDDPQAPTYRAKLKSRLPHLATEGLRPAQIDSVRGLEKSLASGRERALIQMATGAGKTYAAATFSYRLLRYAKAERILFLVDRNNLGNQARSEFENYTTPEDGEKFTRLYNVQQLTGSDMLASSKVVVSTIQRLFLALSGKPIPTEDSADLDSYEIDEEIEVRYNSHFPPETFDLIVVDECHRSIYGKWRSVLEYFDAPIVGLTATPVAQTLGFFDMNLVSEYTYEQAVADGVNVDFDVYRIKTEISESGALIEAGTTIPVRDRRTRRQRYEALDDDFLYGSRDIGVGVISKGQMRTIIETFHDRLYTEIFPERGKIPTEMRMVPKTLIFAKNDEHAEEIVETVRDVFGRGNDFCTKITHKARKPHELLAAFRNSAQLRIAVTVDMIATGTDVKALECLIFMRDVRSWAYFEQMKGRGARTIPQTELQAVTPDLVEKTRFVIVDAIGVTENPKVDAAPLNRDPVQRQSLEKLLRKVAAGECTSDDVSTLGSRLARLNKDLDNRPQDRQELEHVAGKPLHSIARGLIDAVSVDAQEEAKLLGGDKAVQELLDKALEPLANNAALRKRILEIRRAVDIVYDLNNPDQLLAAGSVADTAKATSLIMNWREYLAENHDEIAAWHAAYAQRTRKPHEVYEHLKEIAARIARPPRRWTHDALWQAYEQAGLAVATKDAQHGVADLVPLIRFELGADERPRPYASVMGERFHNWLAAQEKAGTRFTNNQLWWLENIARATAMSVRFDTADLDHVPFSTRGGTDGFLAAFGDDRAVSILHELDQELTA